MPTQHLISVSERLEKIKRENRILKQFVIAALLLAVIAVMGEARPERTVKVERFVLGDAAGRMRAEISMDPSGMPALTFYDERGKRDSYVRDGDLFPPSKNEFTRVSSSGATISTQQGDIELDTAGLRLKITSARSEVFGYASLGMTPALEHEGIIGPALTLQGNRGKGFVDLNTADGPILHLEPGM